MTDHPPADLAYRADVASHILKLLRTGPKSLSTLAENAEGAYPTDVRAALEVLVNDGKAQRLSADTWAASGVNPERVTVLSGTKSSGSHADDMALPEPHPLDYDWRFSRRTLEYLCDLVDDSESHSVAVLGAPTLFKHLADRSKNAHLFDKNTYIVSHLRSMNYLGVTECDLFALPAKVGKFRCAVADPPWYADHYRAFIESARKLLRPGGVLWLSMLPRLTRPSAVQDRADVVIFASGRGFELDAVDPARLHYASPPFEVASLASEGLTIGNWRSGDLYKFVLTARRVGSVSLKPAEPESLWTTFILGRTVIKVKAGVGERTGRLAFGPVAGMQDLRLRSVSRRSPLRKHINVWTSRNVALHVSRPDLLCAGLTALARGQGPQAVADGLVDSQMVAAGEGPILYDLLGILTRESGPAKRNWCK